MAVNRNSSEKIPELDVSQIDEILKNVYDACDTAPSTIPIESLISYTDYRKERHLSVKILTAVAIILFLLLPMLFISPDFTVEETGTSGTPEYVVSVDNFLPVTAVSATMEDGTRLVVYESGVHEYTVQPSSNGKMDINVILFNRQYKTASVTVETLDRTAPAIVSHKTKNGYVYLYIKDEGTGVDYDSVYAVTASGDTVLPAKHSEDKGYIAFRYPKESLNIYVSDKAGNRLTLLVTV